MFDESPSAESAASGGFVGLRDFSTALAISADNAA
jgi:hypothetical protein